MKKLIILAALCLSAFAAIPAQAALISGAMHWRGDVGHSAQVSFVFDDSFDIVGGHLDHPSVPGSILIEGIETLKVEAWDPSGDEILSVYNVIDGRLRYAYFSFFFDTRALKLADFMDVGSSTEYWLSGTDNIRLITEQPEAVGLSGRHWFEIDLEGVPDASTSASLSVLAFAGLICARRLMKKANHSRRA